MKRIVILQVQIDATSEYVQIAFKKIEEKVNKLCQKSRIESNLLCKRWRAIDFVEWASNTIETASKVFISSGLFSDAGKRIVYQISIKVK